MDIVIVGGGKLGEVICHQLNEEGHDITLIDSDQQVIHRLNESLDLKGYLGSATDVSVLKEAGVPHCDIFMSVTQTDEINILSALLAERLGAKIRLARIRNQEYTQNEQFIQENVGITKMINPDREAARDIINVIDYPSASYVEVFNHNHVKLVKVHVYKNSPIIGLSIAEVRARIPDIVVCVIEREHQSIIPRGDTIIHANDAINIISTRDSFDQFCEMAGHKGIKRYKSILIIGGNRLNAYLIPELLKRRMQIKVIESDQQRANKLAIQFPDAEIILGDGTDQNFLQEQRIAYYDVSVAMTHSDEENLMISLYAYDCGVKKNITRVYRHRLLKLVSANHLDVIISPHNSICDALIHIVRSLDQQSKNELLTYASLATDDDCAALEFYVRKGDRVTQSMIKDLPIKNDVIIGVIVRQGKQLIPSGEDWILTQDRLIVIAVDEKLTKADDILR